jgi:ribosomal protein S19E (S16A)
MTTKQWRMLKILDHHDREGTMEVECQWGGYDFGDNEADEAKAWRVNRLVVAGLVRSLVAKGLATDDQDGYGITEAGRTLLEKRAARVNSPAQGDVTE